MIDLSNEVIVHKKNEEIEYLQFRKLLEYKEIVHCYTLKANDFDVAGNDTYEEKKASVQLNYEKLANAMQISKDTILRPYQTHTDVVKAVNEKWEQKKISIFPEEFNNVDGLITNLPNIAFSLGYADCIPLFFYDPTKKVIGNIHSGWKGTLKKIAKNAIEKMEREYMCKPKDIICCIGPSIRKCHFEVEDDVYEMFYKEFLYTGRTNDIISKENTDNSKYYIDTVLINKIILQEAGLKEKNIIDSGICTVCNSSVMHSYRVDKDNAGRNTAIISLV